MLTLWSFPLNIVVLPVAPPTKEILLSWQNFKFVLFSEDRA
jgi:hypothetical protein